MLSLSSRVTDVSCRNSDGDDPASTMTEEDIRTIRQIYSLSPSVFLRRPLPTERIRDARLDEIAVYETSFASGLRGIVPSLVVEIANIFSVSPGQFCPRVWRVLMAIQAFGESHSLDIGVDEILCVYYFTPLPGDISRYTIHPRHYQGLVFDVDLNEKRKLEGAWRQRYLFMKVGYNPGFPTAWFDADVRSKGRAEGIAKVSELLTHDAKHRSVPFLTSKFVLEHCSFWGFDMSSGQRGSVTGAFAEFLAARGKLTEANHTSADSSDDVECVEVSVASKRKASQDIASASLLRRGRVTRANTVSNTAAPCFEILASTESPLVIEELKTKVFSHDFESLNADGTAAIANEVYNDLLKAMSSFHLVERKLSSTVIEVTHERQKVDSLKQQLDLEKKESHALIASKDEAIACLEGKMKDRDLIILGLETDAAKLAREKELLSQEIMTLKSHIDRQKNEHAFFMSGAAIIARWETLRECLLTKRKDWNLTDADMQYEQVTQAQAEFKGLPPPTFDESLVTIAEKECEASGLSSILS